MRQLTFALLAVVAISLPGSILAQNSDFTLRLRDYPFVPPANARAMNSSNWHPEINAYAGQTFKVLQFYQVPNARRKAELATYGIQLPLYLPEKAYIAALPVGFDAEKFSELGVRAVLDLSPLQKMHPSLTPEASPEWALRPNNEIDLTISYFPGLDHSAILDEIRRMNITVVSDWAYARQVTIRVKRKAMDAVAAWNFVMYVEPVEAPVKPHNYGSRNFQQTNVLHTDYSGGLKFDGSGVVIGLGDDGIIGPHIDYEGRILGTFTTQDDPAEQHGDHVGGTIFSAGNLDPKGRGMAPGSELLVYFFSGIISNSVLHHTQDSMVVTNNSYGGSSGGNCAGIYNGQSVAVDQMVRQYPTLNHNFSAGNEGDQDCGWGAGPNWGNLGDGRNIGKNVVTVGALNGNSDLASWSSRGPAEDGRIKPDICAKGVNVRSTVDANDYDSFDGTSMSCPAVSGGTAQLIQAYREFYGVNPDAALLKASMLNTARDLGNPGPDFKHGYGELKLARALKTLESGTFVHDTVDHGDTAKHTITVPAGTVQLRAMIVWVDYEGASQAAFSLVNDLDMRVIDPSMTDFQPWVLDHTPSPALLNANAVRGLDTINNVEQVTIDNPSPGAYTVVVTGTDVPQGPQGFYLVWEFREDAVDLTYPIGGESWVPNEVEKIYWTAWGDAAPFDLLYSADNGQNWDTIAAGIPGGQRYWDWQVPDTISGQCRVRLERGTLSDGSDSTFTIVRVPNNVDVAAACPDKALLSWNPVAGATGYDVFVLGEKYMDSVGTTANTSYWITGLDNMNESYWFSVRARTADGGTSRRARAIYKAPGVDQCPDSNDVAVTTVLAPGNGVIYDCNPAQNIKVKILLQNFSPHSMTNIPVYYQVSGSSVETETFTGTLAAYDTATYVFQNTNVSFATAGISTMKAWAVFPGDPYRNNDTTEAAIEVVSGSVITQLPYVEDFETFSFCNTANVCELGTCVLAKEWTNTLSGTVDDIDWRTSQGFTPTSFTGPETDHNPGNAFGRYLYLEATDCFFHTGEAVTPCIDLSSATTPEMSFWFHKYGQQMGDLHVDIFADGVWHLDLVNPIIGDWTNNWWEETADLSAYASKIVNFRFRGTTGPGEFSDMVIDDFRVYDASVGVDDAVDALAMQVFPNPGTGLFSLSATGLRAGAIQIAVRDVWGRLVFGSTENVKASEFETELDLRGLARGMYYVELKMAGKRGAVKVVLE